MEIFKAYAYCRVSDDHQLDQRSMGGDEADSLEQQRNRAMAYFNANLASQGVEFSRVIFDRAVSASKVPFHRRPGGKELRNVVLPGDHVIIDKVDRMWRSLEDFATQVRWFRENEVRLHFVNMGGATVSSGTPMGDAMLGLSVLFAELESKTLGKRIMDTNEQLRRKGMAVSGYVTPFGTKIEHRGPKHFLVWDMKDRAIAQEIIRLVDVQGMTIKDAGYEIERRLAEAEGRPFTKSVFYKGRWGYKSVQIAYKREKLYRDKGITDPNQIYYHLREAEAEAARRKTAKRREGSRR